VKDDRSSICIGCGLCCDGTLHGRTTVREADERAVSSCGLTIHEEGPKKFFEQPCPHFSCDRCSIYAERPGVCRTYRCELLRAVDERRTSEAEARDRIAMAKTLIEAVRRVDRGAVTPAQRMALVDRLKQDLASQDGEERERTTQAVLTAAALEHFLNRWFLKEQETGAAIRD